MQAIELPPLSLYIHFPWCERKCPYCDFNSHQSEKIPQRDYLAALLSDLRSDLHLVQGRRIDSLFIGGGTPSLMDVFVLRELMHTLSQTLNLSPELEATMEANPGSAEAGKFAAFREAGINRLSLGIQSFSDAELGSLGRVHSAKQAHAAIHMARSAGFDNLNLDLMHGLPGQSSEQGIADLNTALAHHPTHLSWYQLTIEPNTVFYSKPPTLPQENILADLQDQGEALLAAAGYAQYEVSAYSQSGSQCRHNLNYWNFGDYLGIGAGAHGKISFPDGTIKRYAKRRQPDEYLRATQGQHLASQQELSAQALPGEYALNALRLNNGFTLREFSRTTGLAIQALEPQLQQLCERELLALHDGRVMTTSLGRRFLDDVVAAFL